MEKIGLNFNAAVALDDTYMLAVATNINGLFKVNQSTGNSEYLGSFPNEPRYRETMFFEGCLVGNKVFWSPQSSWHIGVYDIEREEISSLEIPYIGETRIKYSDIIEFEGKAYLVACNAKYLLEITPETFEMKYYCAEFEEKMFCRRGCKKGGDLYITSILGDELVVWNLESKESSLVHIGNGFRGSYSSCFVKNELWIAPRYYGDPIVVFNSDTGEIREFLTPFTGEKGKKEICTFLHCFYDGEEIHMISQSEIDSLCINPTDCQMYKDTNFPINSSGCKTGVFFITRNVIAFGKYELDESFFWINKPLDMFRLIDCQIQKNVSFYIDVQSSGYRELSNYMFRDVILEQKGLGVQEYIHLMGATE